MLLWIHSSVEKGGREIQWDCGEALNSSEDQGSEQAREWACAKGRRRPACETSQRTPPGSRQPPACPGGGTGPPGSSGWCSPLGWTQKQTTVKGSVNHCYVFFNCNHKKNMQLEAHNRITLTKLRNNLKILCKLIIPLLFWNTSW